MNEPIKPRERAIAFVVARLGSTRLSAKHLRPIGDRLMLDWVVERLRACTQVDEIVITTVAEPENEPLRAFAEERGLGCFWYEGDVEHVTNRLRCAAEQTGADICILISGDSPLLHSPGIDLLIAELRSAPGADIVGGHPRPGDKPPPLLSGIMVARTHCWQLADDLSDTPNLKRHQFPVISRREERFRIHHFALPEWYFQDGPRLSVDTWADLEFMTAVHDRLRTIGEEFDLGSLIRLLEREPEWMELNSHVRQRKIEESPKRVLFVVESDGFHGQDRLLRSRELALQIIEWKSWSVCFLVEDAHALNFIEARGLPARVGQMGPDHNAAPDRGLLSSISELSSQYDLVVLDFDPERSLSPGWRESIDNACEVAVLDSQRSWANEADFRVGLPRHTVLSRDTVRKLESTHRLGQVMPWKTNDLLTDLRDSTQLEALRRFAERNGLSLLEVDASDHNYTHEVARSRVLITSFGHAILNALALGTVPIAWALSPDEASLVLEFRTELELPEMLVRRESDLHLLHAALATGIGAKPVVVDGTRELIEELDSVAASADQAAA